MKPGDKDKLNQCLDILDTTDLGLSLVWLWTWSTLKGALEDGDFRQKVSEQTAWEELCKSVESGHGFSLEYGAEQHHEDVIEWALETGIIEYLDDEEEEE
jgi:hypothetical protein